MQSLSEYRKSQKGYMYFPVYFITASPINQPKNVPKAEICTTKIEMCRQFGGTFL